MAQSSGEGIHQHRLRPPTASICYMIMNIELLNMLISPNWLWETE